MVNRVYIWVGYFQVKATASNARSKYPIVELAQVFIIFMSDIANFLNSSFKEIVVNLNFPQ